MRLLTKTPLERLGLEEEGTVRFLASRKDDDEDDVEDNIAAVAPDMVRRRRPSISVPRSSDDYS